VDKRIVELLHLLPEAFFEKILLVAFPEPHASKMLSQWGNKIDSVSADGISELPNETYDLVFACLTQRPPPKLLKELLRATSAGGATVLVIPARRVGIKEFQAKVGSIEVHGLSPSIDDLRLAVPLSNKACAAASLDLYQPSLVSAKLKKLAAYCLTRLGLTSFWTPSLMVVVRRDAVKEPMGLHSVIGGLFGKNIRYALFTGTPGYLRKTTIQIMDSRGSTLGFCKIGMNEQTYAAIGNEATTLRLLASLDLGGTVVPQCIYYGTTDNGAAILIQSKDRGHFRPGPLRPDVLHCDFLVRLFNSTKEDGNFTGSHCFTEIAERLKSLERHAESLQYSALKTAFGWCSTILTTHKSPLCLAHRDFTPWNTFAVDNRLYIFDWEFARRDWPPLVDAFHFVVQKALLVDHLGEYPLWRRVSGSTEREAIFLRKVAAMCGISDQAYYGLLAFYLVDMSTTYLLHRMKGGGDTTLDGRGLLQPWQTLLERLLTAQRNVA
jgi:hypothetical protein